MLYLNALVFNLQVVLLIMESTEKSGSSFYSLTIVSRIAHHFVVMEKVTELHMFTKCPKCHTFQVLCHLVHVTVMGKRGSNYWLLSSCNREKTKSFT